jgi:ATP-binding cassette subfamily F protein 3
VVHVNAGQLTHYPGGYQYYLDKTKAVSARAALTAGGGPARPATAAAWTARNDNGVSRKDQKRLEAEQRQSRSKERKNQQQRVHGLEKEIQELEARQTELASELEKSETYERPGRAQEINRELLSVQHRLAELNPEWERQATKLTGMA